MRVCMSGNLFFGQALFLAYERNTLSTPPYMSVGCSFNSSNYTASCSSSSIKGVNMEACLRFIMNNLGYNLSAAWKCDGHSVERLRAILTLIVTGI